MNGDVLADVPAHAQEQRHDVDRRAAQFSKLAARITDGRISENRIIGSLTPADADTP